MLILLLVESRTIRSIPLSYLSNKYEAKAIRLEAANSVLMLMYRVASIFTVPDPQMTTVICNYIRLYFLGVHDELFRGKYPLGEVIWSKSFFSATVGDWFSL